SAVEAKDYTTAYAGDSIFGQMRSRTSDIWAEAGQDVEVPGVVQGYDDVWVVALHGTASASFIADMDQVRVWADENVAGKVSAKTHAKVYSYGSVTAPVNAQGGKADVWAFKNVSGDVWAMWYARVEAGEVLSSRVEVPGDAGGWSQADVYGRQGITGDVSANGEVQAWSGKDLTGNLNATLGKVRAVSIGDMSGNVKAGWDVYLEAGGAVQGDVFAGASSPSWANATVRAGGNLSGEILATGDVFADISGTIVSNITTSRGVVDVLCFQKAEGNVSAGAGVIMRAWGVGGDVRGNEHVLVTSFGPVTGSVTSYLAGVDIYAEGNVSGTMVTGKGDVNIRSLESVTSIVRAGEISQSAGGSGWATAKIWAERDLTGPVSGSWSVNVDVGGAVAGGPLVAGSGMVSVIARKSVQTDITTGGDVWVTAYVDYKGAIRSGNNVRLNVFGSVVADIQAGIGGIEAWASGNMDGKYIATGNVYLETMSKTNAYVAAGDSLTIAESYVKSYGDANLDVVASSLATVWVGGMLTGKIASDEGDALVSTLGDANVELLADDQATLVTLGNVVGTIVGGDDVVVYSTGVMAAEVTSVNGRVGVWANGFVKGGIEAKTGIEITTDGAFDGLALVTHKETDTDSITIHAGAGFNGGAESYGTIRILTGASFSGSVESLNQDVAIVAAGTVTGTVRAAGSKMITQNTPLATPRLIPELWVIDRVTLGLKNSSDSWAAAGVVPGGGQYIGTGPRVEEVKILIYSEHPGSGGRKWDLLLIDKQGGASKVSDGNFATEEKVKNFIDSYVEANESDNVKIVPLKINQCDIHKAIKAANEERSRLERETKEQQAKERAEAEKKAEAERIAALQKQAREDTEKKAAEKKIKSSPAPETMPDGSVRTVTKRQDAEVRATLDNKKIGGIGGKIFIIEDGKLVDPGNNNLALRPTKKEFDAAVKARFLELLDEQERAKPDYMLGKLQMVLDLAGLIPVVGIPFNGTSAGISMYRGDVLGASLALLGMIPFAGDAATSAKIARSGITAANDAARAGRTVERAAELLKHADDAAAILKAQEESKLLLAAALETGYLRQDQALQALKAAGRTEAEANSIIIEAKGLSQASGQSYSKALAAVEKLKSSDLVGWARPSPEEYKTATELHKKLVVSLVRPNNPALLDFPLHTAYKIGSELLNTDLLLLSQLNKAEFVLMGTKDGTFLIRGAEGGVEIADSLLVSGNVSYIYHTHPGINNLIPSLADLKTLAKLDGAVLGILARSGREGQTLVKAEFNSAACKRLLG
ncbi:MAG: hypothetical protein ACRCZF_08985, partial [Gemmataceae bacterium]